MRTLGSLSGQGRQLDMHTSGCGQTGNTDQHGAVGALLPVGRL